MTKDEALKLALEALEQIDEAMPFPVAKLAQKVIREALAQPEHCQCPECQVLPHESDCAVHNEPAYPAGECDCKAQLLSIKQMQGWVKETWEKCLTEAHQQPNQPEQEPVAIVHRNEYNEYRLEPHDNFDIKSIPFNIDVPLFKSPQRTWVGLTDEEIFSVLGNLQKRYNGPPTEDSRVVFALAIEAKLKEKNT
jgi:hypothetical protein